MLILLSCAKTMGTTTKTVVPFTSIPQFQRNADEIAMLMTQYSIEDLEKLLHVNSKIAVENFKRYQEFHSNDTSHLLPALLAYTGIVFKRLNPKDFSLQDFEYAQSHLRLTSFCYGLLQPLDMIRSYRLEGNVKLPEFDGQTLFAYWRAYLTDVLIADVQQSGGVLCNLASDEMKGLFDWSRIENSVKIITPEFSVIKNGKKTTIVIYTKMMRGEMARFILKNRITTLEGLKSFESEGFHYDNNLSTETSPIFLLHT